MSNIRKSDHVFESRYDANWRYVTTVRLQEAHLSSWSDYRVKWSPFLTRGMVAKFDRFFRECFAVLRSQGLEQLMNCDIHVDYNLSNGGGGYYTGPRNGDRLILPAILLMTVDGDQYCKDTILHEFGHRFYSYARMSDKTIYSELTEKYLEYFEKRINKPFPSGYSRKDQFEFWAECWMLHLSGRLRDSELDQWMKYMINKYKAKALGRLPG